MSEVEKDKMKALRIRLKSQLMKDKAKALVRIKRLMSEVDFINEKLREVDFINEKLRELDELDKVDKFDKKEKKGIFNFWK
jgi:hypothetical protein